MFFTGNPFALAIWNQAIPISGERRPSRDRIPTPFVKETGWWTDTDGLVYSGRIWRFMHKCWPAQVVLWSLGRKKPQWELVRILVAPKGLCVDTWHLLDFIACQEDTAVSGDCRGVQFNETATTADIPRESHAGTQVPRTGYLTSKGHKITGCIFG